MTTKRKRLLFIDRDGTILKEPPGDYQVDSLAKFSFYPKVIYNLVRIMNELDYELIMVTNQDGLGTASFPESTFWPYHNKMLETLESEGIFFKDILIDKSFPHENLPTRKPGTKLLDDYLAGDYCLESSFVIGDRPTDVELAQNLNCQSIFLSNSDNNNILATKITSSWDEIFKFLKKAQRIAKVARKTSETEIQIELALDGSGNGEINTGIGMFDHMLMQIAKHSGCDLKINVTGDLHIDEHHVIEDTALTLGEAFCKALGDKKGIARYSFMLPMDECLSHIAIDFSGRNCLKWEAEFKREMIGEMPTEMFFHFFKSFTDKAQCTLHVKADGINEHHKIESIFKNFGRSIKGAIQVNNNSSNQIPSTKGSL